MQLGGHSIGTFARHAGGAALMIYRSPLGRLAWVLGPLGIVALGWGALLASRGHPDAWSALGLATLFLVAAAVFLVSRRRLRIDGLGWRLDRGVLYGTETGRLADVAAVGLTPEAGGPEGGTVWRVDLLVAGDRRIAVLEDLSAEAARVEAEVLALRLRRGLRTPDDTLSPAALRSRVARRLSGLCPAGPGAPAPTAPRGLGAAPPWRLPAPGREALGPVLLSAGALTLLLALHLGSLGLGAGPALLFSAVVLPLEAVAGVALTRGLLRAFARTEVRLEGDALVLRRPLHRVRLPLASVLRLRPGAGRVDVLTVEAAHHLGVRLSPGEERWLAEHLADAMARAVLGAPQGG